MRPSIIDKVLALPTSTTNLIFLGIMIGGSVLILGSLYLIYDVQVFGERTSTKTDLMFVSITFTIIHIILTSSLLFVLKKARPHSAKQNHVEIHATRIGMELGLIDKILATPPAILNLIFIGVMIGGSVLILGSLYLIYDVQVFGERTSTKTDLMFVSITFTIIHIILTSSSSFVFKKMRYARTLIQKEKDEIAKIDKEKDEFAAMIAHELKNPLVPIQSYSKMLQDGRFGDMTSIQKEKMKVIISGTESMLILIQDILDVHKAELGKMQLNIQPVNLCDIAESVITKTQPLAEKRGVTLCNLVGRNSEIKADKYRIEQVLVNIIKNAVDFVPKDTGRILVETELQDSEVIISVTDNGCGMPKSEVDGLFRKFYQSSTSHNGERSSNGLGLAICRNIVEAHGGAIWAESELEKGTSIRFKLQLAIKPEEKRKTLVEKML